jgi:hypothetical protein
MSTQSVQIGKRTEDRKILDKFIESAFHVETVNRQMGNIGKELPARSCVKNRSSELQLFSYMAGWVSLKETQVLKYIEENLHQSCEQNKVRPSPVD